MSYHITLLPGRIYSDIECFFFFLKDECHLLHSFFYNTLIEICNSYAIKFPQKVYNSVGFSIFTEFCIITTNFMTFLSIHKESLLCIRSHALPPSLLQTLATTDLLSVSMDLPILDISYKSLYNLWPFVPASFTYHNISLLEGM